LRTPSAGALVPRLDAAPTLDRIPATSRPPTLPRYENCWLPLLAKLGAAGRGQALPPPDVEWVWIVHLLSPASYIEDCEARYGELIARADSVRRRRAVTVPRPAPTAEPAQVQAHPPPSPPSQDFPLGAHNSSTEAAAFITQKAVSVWEQHYPDEPCAAPVSCPCQSPLPAAWASPIHQLRATSGMRRPTCPPPCRPASLRSCRTTSPPLSSGRCGRSRPSSCSAAAAATAGPRRQRLVPALHLRRWSSTTKYHCRTTLTPLSSTRPPSGAPPPQHLDHLHHHHRFHHLPVRHAG